MTISSAGRLEDGAAALDNLFVVVELGELQASKI